MLERFRNAKEREIKELLQKLNNGELQAPPLISRPSFKKALMKSNGIINIIAEYKRASPSRGVICKDANLEAIIQGYESAGCSAISVLTETQYFQGDFSYLDETWKYLQNKALPILRKDFIFHPVQILHSAYSRAAAILLIVRSLADAKKLADFQKEAHKWQLQCVVEVFDENDLLIARESGADIIQVNARDLNTLQVSRNDCLRLIDKYQPQPGEVWIAASGISEPAHLKEAESAGFNACLIGSSLMSHSNPGQALKELLKDAG